MTRTLVLLTNDFPATSGDYAFLRHEIGALASSFDKVLIYSYKKPTGKLAPLPQGVDYMGDLASSSRLAILKGLCHPGTVVRAIRAIKSERKLGRKPTPGNIFTGIRFAQLIGVNDRPGERTSVYCFWATGAAVAVPFLSKNGPVVVRAHGYDLFEDRNPNLPLRGSIFASPNIIAPISEHGRNYILEKYAAVVDPNLVALARLGTEDHGVGPEPAKSFHVVSCSSLADLKRVPLILQAVSEVAETRKVSWTHLGGNGPLLQSLQSSSEEALLASGGNLSISLPGQMANEQVMSFYQHNPVSVFVNASTTEGVPVSIMEAMSFGIPVVATDVGGTSEILRPEAGILVPPDASATKIAEAVLKVGSDRTKPGPQRQLTPRKTWERLSNAKTNTAVIVALLTG